MSAITEFLISHGGMILFMLGIPVPQPVGRVSRIRAEAGRCCFGADCGRCRGIHRSGNSQAQFKPTALSSQFAVSHIAKNR